MLCLSDVYLVSSTDQTSLKPSSRKRCDVSWSQTDYQAQEDVCLVYICLGQGCKLTCFPLKDVSSLTLDGLRITLLKSRVSEDMAVLRGNHTELG